MIPKKIHYCWFGGSELPAIAKKCIRSWKRYCKDYEIVRWDETNFDISTAPLYVRQAYEFKKWAFVTDYIRLKIVYENGGIYFDTDVQVIKKFDDFLVYNSFFGFQDNTRVNTGLGFGAEKHSTILRELMNQYERIPFVLNNGVYDLLDCPTRNTDVFLNHGLKQDGTNQLLEKNIKVFSQDYFCPISYDTLKKRVTKNTHSIHWFEASWHTQEEKMSHKIQIKKNEKLKKLKKRKTIRKRRRMRIKNLFIRVFGNKIYEKIRGK